MVGSRRLTQYHLYPPLVYWVADAFYAVFGTDGEWAAVLSQSVFLTVLAFSTYGLGRHLWSRRVGLLSAFFVVMSPMVISQFKDFLTDVPLLAMTAGALYLLVRCEASRLEAHRWPSVSPAGSGCSRSGSSPSRSCSR